MIHRILPKKQKGLRLQEEGKGGVSEQIETFPPPFEEMLSAILPLYKALLQAIAALGFPCVLSFCL